MSLGIVHLTLAGLMFGVFAVAVKHKIAAFPRFRAVLSAYQLLPNWLLTPMGCLLIVAELLACACFLMLLLSPLQVMPLGSGAWVTLSQIGFGTAVLLFSTYLLAMTVNFFRGHRLIDCGCGEQATAIGLGTFLRNALLILGAVTGVAMASVAHPLGSLAAIVAYALALVAWLQYQAAEQMLANSTLRQQLWATS